jgi:hypothetical protein
MRAEAEETERRCTEVADQREGKKTAILERSSSARAKRQSRKASPAPVAAPTPRSETRFRPSKVLGSDPE